MAKFKKDDILIYDSWHIIIILDIENIGVYKLKLIKKINDTNTGVNMFYNTLNYVDTYYRLLTDLEKIKYL